MKFQLRYFPLWWMKQMTAIVLENPKYPHNVGAALRAASCYGVEELIYTGNRVIKAIEEKGKYRLPREERMRGYNDVFLLHNDKPIDRYKGQTIVAVELIPGTMPLTYFEHPDNAVYV